MNPERTKRLGLAAFGLSIATLALVAPISFRNWHQFSDTAEVVASARQVSTLHREIRSALLHAETDQLRFLLTGSGDFRRAYELAVSQIPGKLDQLVKLTRGDPTLSGRVDSLNELARAALDDLRASGAVRETKGLAASLAVLDANAERRTSVRLWSVSDEIEFAHRAMLLENWDTLIREAHVLRWLTVSGALLLACFVGCAALALNRAVNTQESLTASVAEARDLMLTTLYSIGDGVITTDRQGRVSMMNPVAERLTEYSEKDARGLPIEDVFRMRNEETLLPEPSPVRRVLAEGSVTSLNNHTLLIGRSGREIPIDDSGAPIRGQGGKIEGVVLVFRDVTERKTADEALYQSERRFRMLADSAPVMIWSETPDGERDYFNLPWLEYRGRSLEQEVGQGWTEGIHPEDQVRHAEISRTAHEARRRFSVEYRLRRSDGRYCWILSRAVPRFDSSGEFLGYIGSCADIDDMKRAEERLRHAAKLESLGVLAGGIAHDFNNILVGILGSACLLEEYIPENSPARDLVTGLQQASDRAARLTRQMLAYSGRGRFFIEALDLTEQVREVIPLIQASIPKTVEMRLGLAEGLPAVAADATQIQQIIMNLVINAAEATGSGGGWVRVSTYTASMDEEPAAEFAGGSNLPPGQYVALEVSDNGQGMDTETKSKIFDPFFTTKFAGRGLGLAAALGIVRSHHGAIKVESTPNTGSVFTVYLPVLNVRRSRPDEETDDDAIGAGKILVVDDEEPVRVIARNALQRVGFTVLTAADGAEAVQIFRREAGSIRAVVLDLSMPGINAEETLRQLRELGPEVPVVVSSGYTEIEVSQRFGTSINGFLPKPFTVRQLAGAVCAVLRKTPPT